MAKAQKIQSTPESRFGAARGNLLLVVIFTAINLVLLMVESNTQFLFSASFPSMAYMFGQVFTEATGLELFRVGALLLGVGNIGLYLLCWLCSKKHRGFMIFALVLFCLDCLVFLLMLYLADWDASGVIDAVFHGWVLISLISGVAAMPGLRRQEAAAAAANPAAAPESLETYAQPEAAETQPADPQTDADNSAPNQPM